MNNISDIKHCFGCGVCATSCGRKIINIQLDEDGFYQPYIDDIDKCTNCGICRDVCSFLHDDLSLKERDIHSYAAWSYEKAVQRKSSSGGVGFEIGRYLITQGYKAIGVRYNVDKGIAEHYVASNVEEFIQSMGSKYIQSYTVDAFRQINRKEKYLVTGTPCQIDSIRRYIKRMRLNEDNFVLLDFFCHGVPSMLMWNKYVKSAEKKVGEITYISWRNKWTGWHDSWAMGIDGKKTENRIEVQEDYDTLIKERKCTIQSRLSQGDEFYKLFLGDFCMNPACRNQCKYKYAQSSADIRIGDLWGQTYQDNEDGVSAAIAFTPKGLSVLQSCNCEFTEHPFEIVAEGQMKGNCGRAHLSGIVKYILLSKITPSPNSWKRIFLLEKLIRKIMKK